MTDRDHFASAALAGLIANGDDGSFTEESYARSAYRWADAMLRERERVTEPMPKEKRAEVFADPVAWAVVYPNNEVAVIAFKRQDAEERAAASDRIVPLYRHPQPTLADAEREAVDAAQNHIDGYDGEWGDRIAATLRALLERTK